MGNYPRFHLISKKGWVPCGVQKGWGPCSLFWHSVRYFYILYFNVSFFKRIDRSCPVRGWITPKRKMGGTPFWGQKKPWEGTNRTPNFGKRDPTGRVGGKPSNTEQNRNRKKFQKRIDRSCPVLGWIAAKRKGGNPILGQKKFRRERTFLCPRQENIYFLFSRWRSEVPKKWGPFLVKLPVLWLKLLQHFLEDLFLLKISPSNSQFLS